MLKSKRSLFILLPLAILVWGTLLYKFFNGLKGTVGGPPPVLELPVSKNANRKEKAVVLNLNYPDPFLGVSASNTEAPVNKQPQSAAMNRVIPWPSIQYRGSISSSGKKKQLGLLKVGMKEVLVHERDEILGVSVRKITSDSIQLVYKGQKKYFIRTGLENRN